MVKDLVRDGRRITHVVTDHGTIETGFVANILSPKKPMVPPIIYPPFATLMVGIMPNLNPVHWRLVGGKNPPSR